MPDKKRVDVSERGVSGFCQLANAFDVVENPTDLQTAEVSREGQSCLGAEAVLTSGLCEFFYIVGNARVLPDESIRDGLAGLPIPYDRRFPLIRDSNGCEVSRLKTSFCHGFRDHLARALPDFFRVVFHPSRA